MLSEAPKKDAPSKLDIKQGANGLMTVPGLVAQPVRDTDGVLDAFEQGNATRSVAATKMNATSSRSHMILMVDVTTRTNEGASVTGRLYLVDLAGRWAGGIGLFGGCTAKKQNIADWFTLWCLPNPVSAWPRVA